MGEIRPLRIYFDNCCFNRPFDDQSSLRIALETQAKLYIQDMIRQGRIQLASSYMLAYENGQNPFEERRTSTADFLNRHAAVYVGVDRMERIRERAGPIMRTGIRVKDAHHVACAIEARCDCLISTDDRLLKYRSTEIALMNPLDFVRTLSETEGDYRDDRQQGRGHHDPGDELSY